MRAVVVILKRPPPVRGGCPTLLRDRVCVRVCFGFLETAPPRCEAETQAAGAADAHRLFTSRGDREGENKRETIAEKSQERWIAPRNSARHMSLVPPL